MYTYNGTAIYCNVEPSKEAVLVAVATSEGRAAYIVDALNKEAYTHKAAPQFQPWDIVRNKDFPEWGDGVISTECDRDDDYMVVFPDKGDWHYCNVADLEFVERLADRKAQG